MQAGPQGVSQIYFPQTKLIHKVSWQVPKKYEFRSGRKIIKKRFVRYVKLIYLCTHITNKQKPNKMKRFNKTYKTDGFRVRIQISDTSDRLTIYEVRDNSLGRRIKYEWYFERKNLINDMVKDLMDVKVPTTTICDVVTDIKMNLIFLGLYKN